MSFNGEYGNHHSPINNGFLFKDIIFEDFLHYNNSAKIHPKLQISIEKS